MSRRKSGKKVSKVNTIETKVATILESLNVPFEQQVTIDKYTVDFLVDKKYIVECMVTFGTVIPISILLRILTVVKRKPQRKSGNVICKEKNSLKKWVINSFAYGKTKLRIIPK